MTPLATELVLKKGSNGTASGSGPKQMQQACGETEGPSGHRPGSLHSKPGLGRSALELTRHHHPTLDTQRVTSAASSVQLITVAGTNKAHALSAAPSLCHPPRQIPAFLSQAIIFPYALPVNSKARPSHDSSDDGHCCVEGWLLREAPVNRLLPPAAAE